MSAGSAQAWFIAGAIPFVLAGAVHGLATLVDTIRPRFFTPIERSVRPVLDSTGIRFRELFPGGSGAPSLWRAWLGFNLSHSLGLSVFGLFCLLLAVHDFDLIVESVRSAR